MSRRKFLWLLVGIIVIIIPLKLAAAGQQEPSKEKVTITIGIEAWSEADAHDRNKDRFEASHPNIKLNVDKIPAETYLPKLMSVLTSRTGSYDVVVAYQENFRLFVQSKYIVPLDPFFSNSKLVNAKDYDLHDFPDPMLAKLTMNGNLYAIPQAPGWQVIYYRKDLFAKQGLQEFPVAGPTWDEYMQAIAKCAQDTSGGHIFGTMNSGKNHPSQMQEVLSVLGSLNIPIMTSDYKVTINDPKGVDLLYNFYEPIRKGWTPPDPSAYFLPDIVKGLQSGNVAMAMAWQSQGESFATAEQTDYPIPTKMGFSVIPHDPSGGVHAPRIWPALWALAINADSKHKQEAFQYITWFTGKETAKEVLLNGGGVSGRRSLIQDPAILKARPLLSSGVDGIASWYDYPPILENFDLLHQYLPSYTSKLMTTDMSKSAIKSVMDESAVAVEQFLKEHGYKK